MRTKRLASSPVSALAGPVSIRRQNRQLRYAHLGWSLGVTVCAALFVPGIPALFAQLHTPYCGGPNCNNAQLLPADFHALGGPSAATDAYAVFALTVIVTTSLIFFTVGGLIALRRWHDRSALFVSFILILLGALGVDSTLGPPIPANPSVLLILLVIFVTVLQYALLATFLLTFPTGRFTPRWSVLLIVVWILQVGLYFVSTPDAVLAVSGFVTWGSAAAIQLYRFIQVYTPRQRQQTKWVVFSLVLVEVVGRGIYTIAPKLWPALNTPGSWYHLAKIALDALVFLPISLGVGIAILRSKLYDIDIIIRRTLLYGTLTALLATVYFVSVIVFQAVTQALTGRHTLPPIAIVASTLLAAILFSPLRRRIQEFIDFRFDRRRYDATRILGDFAMTVRSEVDLDQLSEQLQKVVQDTMRPEHVSLWLRPLSSPTRDSSKRRDMTIT